MRLMSNCATAISAAIKPVITPEDAEKKSHVADARGNERFFRRSCGARPVDPKSNEQIRREPDQFPKNEQQKQTVRDDDAKHCAGKKRQIRKETRKVFVV